ncbi:tetratricopeptide repeat protein [Yunchengibacter salinarum]|uniref:tetratricopeptide repeat protein n=1 Tax=Yunchengibacter salinarum TaxID=3133399 RepID=UPI0035B58D3F
MPGLKAVLSRTGLLAVALGLAACAGQGTAPDAGVSAGPVPAPWRSAFDGGAALDDAGFGPFAAALIAESESRHDRSARYYLEALKASPENPVLAERAFAQLLYSGRVGEAARLTETLLAVPETEPVGPSYRSLAGLLHVLKAFRDEDWATARTRMDAHLNKGFAKLIAPALRAWTHAGEGDTDAAIKALDPLLNHPRLHPIGLAHKAYLLDHAGRDQAATDLYKALTSADRPASFQPFIAYAHMMARQGDLNQAVNFLYDSARRFGNSRFLMREAVRIKTMGRPTQVVARPQGAAGFIFYRLASEFSSGGSNRAAILYLRLSAYMAPEVEDTTLLLGSKMADAGDHLGAAEALTAIPKGSPLWRSALGKRIDALWDGGDEESALSLARNSLRVRPKDRPMLRRMGDMLRARNRFEEADVYYSRIIDGLGDPGRNDWGVFFVRGIAREQAGDWPGAERDLLTALELKPDDPNVLNYLGYSWIDRDMHETRAKDMIRRAAKARPEDGFILDSLGWVHFLTGDYEKAVVTLERAVKLEPGDPVLNEHLGDAYWKVGRRIEARFQWRHALTGGPDADREKALKDKLAFGLNPAAQD